MFSPRYSMFFDMHTMQACPDVGHAFDAEKFAEQLKNAGVDLVGFGDSIIARTFSPPLSTIAQDFEEMGSRTVNWLTDVIEKKGSVLSSGCRIPTGFIQRESIYGKEK